MQAPLLAEEVEGSLLLVKLEPQGYDDSETEGACAEHSEHTSFLLPYPEESSPLELDTRDAVPHPAGEQFRCLHCHRDLSPADLQRHMTIEHGYRRVRFKCQVCSHTFNERAQLAAHRTQRHATPVELVTCEICYQQVGKKYLHKHIQNVHCVGGTAHQCPTCEKLFKSKETLKDHVRSVHRAAEPVRCRLCSQQFKSNKYLVNHVRNVHPAGDKVFECSACSKVFKSRMCLHQHTKNVHPPKSASVPCTACSKVFKTKANLAQHTKHCHPSRAGKRAKLEALADFLKGDERRGDLRRSGSDEMDCVDGTFADECFDDGSYLRSSAWEERGVVAADAAAS